MLAHGFLRRKLLGVKIELLCTSYPLSPEPCHRLGEVRSLPAATLAQARGKVSRPAPVLICIRPCINRPKRTTDCFFQGYHPLIGLLIIVNVLFFGGGDSIGIKQPSGIVLHCYKVTLWASSGPRFISTCSPWHLHSTTSMFPEPGVSQSFWGA